MLTEASNIIHWYGGAKFDEALKSHFYQTFKVGGENRFITGSGRNLGLTGYFTTYEHVDGHVINVVKLPLFDHGPVAQARENTQLLVTH